MILDSSCWAAEADWPEHVKFGLVNGRVIDRRSDGIVFDIGTLVSEHRFAKGDIIPGGYDLIAIEDGVLSLSMSFSEFYKELGKFHNVAFQKHGVFDVRRLNYKLPAYLMIGM